MSGQLVGQWPVKKLGDFSNIRYGYTEKSSPEPIGPRFLRITDIKNGGVNWNDVPYCRITDEDFSKYQLEKGDIVFARTGATTGKSFLIAKTPDAVFASYLIRVQITDSAILPEFVYFYFQSASYWDMVNAGISGSAQGGFNASKLSELTIPIPSFPEQQRIVRILDKAFENISAALERSKKELFNANALFESLLDGTFSQSIKGEDGVLMPLWPSQELSKVCDKIQDGAHKSPKILYDEPGHNRHPYVTSKNIRNGYLKLDTLQYCGSDFHNEIYPRCNAELGDVLLTKDGASTGNVTINTLDMPFSLLSSVCLFKTNSEKLLPKFLYYYIRSRQGLNQLTGKMTGAAIRRIVLKTIKSSEIPLPSISEQENTIEFLDKHTETIDKLASIYSAKINDWNELKQSILQEAFNGTLRIAEGLVDQS